MYRPELQIRDLGNLRSEICLIGLVVLAVVIGSSQRIPGPQGAGMNYSSYLTGSCILGMAVYVFLKVVCLNKILLVTVGSIGDSVAAGAIFTLAAFFIAGVWGGEEFFGLHSYMTASLNLVVPVVCWECFLWLSLRRVMVEDKELPFLPESTAAAEILKSGRIAQGDSKYLIWAMVGGALGNTGFRLAAFCLGCQSFFQGGPG